MNKNIVGVCMILVIGIVISLVSASLMNYYGQVVQEIKVEGVIFYANTGNELLINKVGNGHSIEIFDSNSRTYYTSEFLEPFNFYIPHIDFQVRAKIINGTKPNDIYLIFGYVDFSNNFKIICNSFVLIDSYEFNEYIADCDGILEPLNVKKFYYEIRGNSGSNYRISTMNNKTKVEVSPI